MTHDDELQVIQKVIYKDRNAFEVLVLANQKEVYNLALRIIGDWSEALDISQEAFLKAFLQLGSFRGESRFSVWMYRLTYNLCIDYMRNKKHRNREIPLIYQDESGEDRANEIPDLRNLPEDGVLRYEVRTIMIDCINELKPGHRKIIFMREIAEMTYSEIAATLNMNIGTVKSRIFRARMCLNAIIREKSTLSDYFHYYDNNTENMVFSLQGDYSA